MKYFLNNFTNDYGKYHSFRYNYREGKEIKSKQVYLGKTEVALKLISDFSLKKPENEKLLSYSGEIILSKIAEQCHFGKIINDIIKRHVKYDIGKFIQILTIERTLYKISKWSLANNIHEKSFFSLDNEIGKEGFSEDNIYNYMDYIFPYIHEIQVKILEHIKLKYKITLDELILDGTSVYCFGRDEEDDEEDEETENGEEIRRVKGYNRDKRPNLPQINLTLGINNQYIPLLFETFSGNIQDVEMFEKILDLVQSRYQILLNSIRKSYLVFDRGNNNPDNIKEIDSICQKWKSFFVASIKSTMVKSELMELNSDKVPEIYSYNHTSLFGKTINKKLYGKERTVLLYVNNTVRKQKIENFLNFLEKIEQKVAEIVQKNKNEEEKIGEIKAILRRYNLISRFSIGITNNVVKCTRIKEKIDEKIALFGKYALVTNDLNLDGLNIIRIYKTKDKIEQEFHLIKSLFDIRPIFHYRPNRIQTHFAIVLWGVLFCAILKLVLSRNDVELSFEHLMNIIKEGRLSIGDYVYPESKTFRIEKTLNISPDLEKILKILKIKYSYFNINVIPTHKNKKRGENSKKNNNFRE